MLLIFVVAEIPVGNFVCLHCSDGNIEESLERKFKSSYLDIYDYTELDLHFIKLIHVKRGCSVPLKSFSGSDCSKLSQMIDYMNQFPYHADQEDPNLVESKGGNCMALSIYFKNLCEHNGISCSVVPADDEVDSHVLNEVVVDDSTFLVDLSTKTFKEKE